MKDAGNVRRYLQTIVEEAGVKGSWTPQELRHTFVSWMSVEGASDDERPEPVPQLSQLAIAPRNGTPRAVRDRLDINELERLLVAAQSGVSRMQLVAEFGVSRKTIYRLLKASGSAPSKTSPRGASAVVGGE